MVLGPPGAGTSTVGRLVADRAGLPWRDSDRDVEAQFGASAADIFLEAGEQAFRDAERELALQALEGHEGVLVLGGGAVMDPLIAEALRRRAGRAGTRVVFLDVTISDAARRLGLNVERPSGIGAPRSQWLRMMEQRRRIYAELADLTVLTDGLTPQQVAEQVLEQVPDPSAATAEDG